MSEPSKADLEARADELGLPTSGTKADLEERITAEEARRAAQEAAPPVADEAKVDPDPDPEPAPDPEGQSVRGRLADVAQERAANPRHVRVIGAETPEEA